MYNVHTNTTPLSAMSCDDIYNGLLTNESPQSQLLLLQLLCNTCNDESQVSKLSLFQFCLSQAAKIIQSYSTVKSEIKENLKYYYIVCSNLTTVSEQALVIVNDLILTNPLFDDFAQSLSMFLDSKTVIPSGSSSDLNSNLFWEKNDYFQHVASLTCNLSQYESFREVLCQKSKEYIPRLLNQLKSQNVVRRRGVVATIRNCLFDSTLHWWLVDELKILSYLLPPIIAPIPFTDREKLGMNPLWFILAENEHKKIDDVEIVTMIMECIVLLCQTRTIRTILRKKKVYPICRNVDYYLESLLESRDLTVHAATSASLGNGANLSEVDKAGVAYEEPPSCPPVKQERTDRINEIMHDIVNFLERDEEPL